MSKKNDFFRVNWVDGMKINKDSFVAFEDSMLHHIEKSSGYGITPNNFGLLPDYTGAKNTINVTISMDGHDTLVIAVNRCNAVTLGGNRITIDDAATNLFQQAGHLLQQEHVIKDKTGVSYIVLSVDQHARIPIGDADPYEEPARHPFVLPSYQITVVPENQLNIQLIGSHHITIGKVVWDNERPQLMDSYIPPCTSIQSHQDLIYTYTEVGAFLNGIESYATSIIQKIYQKQQTNDMAKMVLTMANDVLSYLKSAIPVYRSHDKYAPPVEMIVKLMCLARTIKGSLDIYAGTGKEELLNYLTEWCDQNQGAFENVLQEMIDLEYIHTDVNQSLEKVATFTMLMTVLFKKLHELDYIGKKSDSKIFVKEDVIVQDDVKKRRRFFLE